MDGNSLLAKIDEIRKWHKRRGFVDIGYHWIIDRDGKCLAGRPEGNIGAHTKNHNSKSIGVCLIGGFGSSVNDQFNDNFTQAQEMALRELVADINTRYHIKKISGHNDYDTGKACPGFRVARSMVGQAATGE